MSKTIFKFKIYQDEDDDEFLRELEIDANSSFEDFHYAVLEAVGINGNELASFYLCDKFWNKDKEITLLDMSEEENRIDIMSNSKLKDFIQEDSQKLIYEYDFLNLWTFLIELIDKHPAKAKVKYPVCTKKVGKLEPRTNLNKSSIMPEGFDENDFEFTEKEILDEDDLNEGFGYNSEEFADDDERY